MLRKINLFDSFITEVDNALRAILPPVKRKSNRYSPAEGITEVCLSKEEKKHLAGLMRVNHSGEVCAQALYQGQALTARLTHIKKQMNDAASEEVDHLAWCEQRLSELGSHPSLLNFIWYGGSITLGAFAGLMGDKISLGFVAETERQVSAHLERHLQKIPEKDQKSISILVQMKKDEEQHAHQAILAGASELPYIVKQLMHSVSKLMTFTSYFI